MGKNGWRRDFMPSRYLAVVVTVATGAGGYFLSLLFMHREPKPLLDLTWAFDFSPKKCILLCIGGAAVVNWDAIGYFRGV